MRNLRVPLAGVLCLLLGARPAPASESAWEVLAGARAAQELSAAPEVQGEPIAAIFPDEKDGIILERHGLLTLLAMAHAYTQLKIKPPPGYDIAAVLAWNVEDTEKTPEFVIERNRNFERRGNIHHAEVNAILAAYKKGEDVPVAKDADRKELKKSYDQSLSQATLYTTLEPCPMCAATIAIAKIPRAIFCMEDPGLRDPKTRRPNVETPTKFFDRKLSIEEARVGVCVQANKALWEAIGRGEQVKITQYLADKGEAIFKPAYDALRSYKPRHGQNKAVLDAIQKEILPGAALPERLAEERAPARGRMRYYNEQLPLGCRKPLPAEEGAGARPEELFK